LTGTGVALAALGGGAAAQTLTIKVADSLPVGHYASAYTVDVWMKEVKKQAGDRIAFEYFPAEQLGKAKDMLALTQSRVTDIGYVVPAFVPDKMPLSVVAELPLEAAVGCRGTRAVYKLITGESTLAKAEFAANGVRPLFIGMLPPFQIFTRKEFSSLKDLQGLKIRTTGAAKSVVLQKLGAVPVQIPSPEVREAMSRGTVDGILFVFASLFPWDIHPMVNTATAGENFGGYVYTYVINEQKWRTLPADIQALFASAGKAVTEQACQRIADDDAKDMERLRKLGAKILTFSSAEKAEIRARMTTVAEDWAKDLDRRGKPGSTVLKEFQAALGN